MSSYRNVFQRRVGRRAMLGATTATGLGLAGLGLVGCGDDDDEGNGADPTSTPSSDATATQGADPTATPEGGPQRGGTLIVEAANPIPAALFGAFNPSNDYIQDIVWDSLIRRGEDFTPVAGLADSFEFRDDHTGVVFHLPAGLEFHDGKPVTSQTVRESIEMYRSDDITTQLKNPLTQVTDISTEDEQTIELTFSGPRPAMVDTLALLPIIDAATFPNVTNATPDVVNGTGPFRLTEFVPDQSYRLEKFENYWKHGQPYLDALEGKIFADQESRVLALQTGDIMHTNQLEAPQVAQLSGNDDLTFTDLGQIGLMYLGLIVDKPLLTDVRVRQAIMIAVDRQRLSDEWAEGVIPPAQLPWPPGSPGYVDEDAALADYDPDRARSLIDEAGANGATLTLTIGNRSPRPELAQFVQADLTDIGLNVELDIVEYSIFLDGLRSRALPDHGWISGHGFSDGMHPATLVNSAQQYRIPNPNHYESDEYADLIERINLIDPSTEVGVQTLREFNRRYVWDDPWLVPLVPQINYWGMRSNVMGATREGGLVHGAEDWWIAS